MKTALLTTPANKKYPQTTVTLTINASITDAFNYLAPINLTRIFPGTGLIAGIANTTINEGWNKAGLSRTIFFKDGTTSKETMLTFDGPTSFSYKNEQFSSKVLGSLMTRLEGEWKFVDLKNGSTKIEWTYRAIPKNYFAKLFVKYVLIKMIHGMLHKALSIGKADLETGNLPGLDFNNKGAEPSILA
ncbi:MAG: SRPBCC family protein [Vallitaleaceae bacterium]|nr:SRPBCC family protein [Vallitaleaceae bacterium]